jgi:hypothetical protein
MITANRGANMGITEEKAEVTAKIIRITMGIRVIRAGMGITRGETGIIGTKIMRCTASTIGSEA